MTGGLLRDIAVNSLNTDVMVTANEVATNDRLRTAIQKKRAAVGLGPIGAHSVQRGPSAPEKHRMAHLNIMMGFKEDRTFTVGHKQCPGCRVVMVVGFQDTIVAESVIIRTDNIGSSFVGKMQIQGAELVTRPTVKMVYCDPEAADRASGSRPRHCTNPIFEWSEGARSERDSRRAHRPKTGRRNTWTGY